jgi:hypothetical protein
MVELIKAIIPLLVQIYKIYMKYYNALTPEEQIELCKAAKESFDKAGNMGSGVGE